MQWNDTHILTIFCFFLHQHFRFFSVYSFGHEVPTKHERFRLIHDGEVNDLTCVVSICSLF